MKKTLAFLAMAALPVMAASLPADTPLVSDGPVVVDVRDLDAFMLTATDQQRAQVRMSYDRIATMTDSVFLTRVAANRARAEGLDKDPTVQRRLQQVQEQVLAELYMDHIRKAVHSGDLEQRARELYDAEPERYKTPETVHVQQVLVSLWGRTREMALERAQKAVAEAKAGKKDFLEISAQYSDDTQHNPNGGDFNDVTTEGMPGPVVAAIAKMKPGEISAPIETQYGFHVLRFVSRHPAERIPFEKVKERIIAAEKDRLENERSDEFVSKVRGSKTVVVHTANVQAYVIPLDQKKVQEALKAK